MEGGARGGGEGGGGAWREGDSWILKGGTDLWEMEMQKTRHDRSLAGSSGKRLRNRVGGVHFSVRSG